LARVRQMVRDEAEFGVTVEKTVKDPKQESFGNMDKLPEDMQKFVAYAQKLVDPVKTYDMQTHEIKVEGEKTSCVFERKVCAS
jgi:hypothetical protein